IKLSKRRAEKMSALRIVDEVEELRVRGNERCAKRNLARVPDRARRKSSMHVSIVRRVLAQVVETQRAIVAALLFQRVNYRRVALQRHAFPQAVLEDTRNQRPFVWLRRFAFDERGQGDCRKQRASQRLSGFVRTWWRDLRPFFAEFLFHLRSQFLC